MARRVKKTSTKPTRSPNADHGTSRKRARSPEPSEDAPVGAGTLEPTGADKPAAKRLKTNGGATTQDDTSAYTPTLETAPIPTSATVANTTPVDTECEVHRIDYSGEFNLYSMTLPFLNSVYAPNKANSRVFPEELYKKILTFRAKNDWTAKINISNGSSTAAEEGTFTSLAVCDPMSDMPFDIELSCVGMVPTGETAGLVRDSRYARPPKDDGGWIGEGLKVGMMQVVDGGCGIASSYGNLCLVPMWAKGEGADRMELWEGKISFKVRYSGMYSRKGHGTGQNDVYNFWAVRGRKLN